MRAKDTEIRHIQYGLYYSDFFYFKCSQCHAFAAPLYLWYTIKDDCRGFFVQRSPCKWSLDSEQEAVIFWAFWEKKKSCLSEMLVCQLSLILICDHHNRALFLHLFRIVCAMPSNKLNVAHDDKSKSFYFFLFFHCKKHKFFGWSYN